MAVEALNLDPNVWYYIQSFGTDFYLEAGSTSTSMALGTDSTSDKALWQYGTVAGSSTGFLRSKADKTCFVPVLSSQNQDTIPTQREQCSDSSLTWSVANWNGQNVADGLFFESDDLPGTYYVFAQLEGQVPVMQKQISGNQSTHDVFYQWAFTSVSPINDQAYSTLFASSSASSSATATGSSQSSTPTTTAQQTSSSSNDSSTTSIPSIETTVTTVTAELPTSTNSQETGPSTLTVIVTPSATSRSSAPSATASVGLNAAGRVSVMKSVGLAVAFCALCLPQML